MIYLYGLIQPMGGRNRVNSFGQFDMLDYRLKSIQNWVNVYIFYLYQK